MDTGRTTLTIAGDFLTISTAPRVAVLNRTSAAFIAGIFATAGLVFLLIKPLSKLDIDAIADLPCGIFLVAIGIVLAVGSAVSTSTNVVTIDRATNQVIKGRKSISLANCSLVSIAIHSDGEGGTTHRVVLNRIGNCAITLWEEPDVGDAKRIAAEVGSFFSLPN